MKKSYKDDIIGKILKRTQAKTIKELPMCKKNGSIGFAMGILAGVVGGIVGGLLIAPKTGEETRQNLKAAIDDLSEKLSPEVREAKRQALDMINCSKHKIEQMYRNFNDSIKAEKLAKAKNMENDVYGI